MLDNGLYPSNNILLKYRSELQEEHYNDLRSELFKHIFMLSSGPRIVLTRLCVAVSISEKLFVH